MSRRKHVEVTKKLEYVITIAEAEENTLLWINATGAAAASAINLCVFVHDDVGVKTASPGSIVSVCLTKKILSGLTQFLQQSMNNNCA